MISTGFSFLVRGSIGLSAVLAGTGFEPSDEELERHQGVWQAVSFVYDGSETPKEIVETITRTVDNDHVAWKRSGKSFAGTSIKVDASKDPKTIDVIADGGPNRDKPVLGIYKLEGDDLTICMAAAGKERPKRFDEGKGSGLTVMKFLRVKPTTSLLHGEKVPRGGG